jgi:alpha-mannosidase
LTITGKLGASVKAILAVNFYIDLARIDLDWTFAFDSASIGHFFDDDTKLRVKWPLSFKGNIYHDISFGVVETRDERPFLPLSWVDISDGSKGLAYFNQGTLKHWVAGKTLVNLFAWGEDTDAIGNRIDMVRWPKCFDQRLHGIHVIHTAIYPHSGDWRSANVIGAARNYGVPLIAIATDQHPGVLPDKMTTLQLSQPEIVATTVRIEAGQVLCRFYSVSHQAIHVEMGLERLKLAGIMRLSGEPVEWIGPFQIGKMLLSADY